MNRLSDKMCTHFGEHCIAMNMRARALPHTNTHTIQYGKYKTKPRRCHRKYESHVNKYISTDIQ